MEGTNVGQISLGLDINKSLFNKQLNGIASGAQKSVTNAFKPIGKLIGGALALGSIVSFTKSCLDLGSNLQEVQNVVDVTFGSMRGKVDEFASTAIDKFGLSETVAKKMMGTYGAMSKSFGFNPQEVYDMSEAITGLTADVASFYNLETDEAYTKMKSIWTGETESLKELGVVMTQTALDQYALNNGFGKTTAAMTEQEKVMLRYQFVQSQLSDASGDFARTSGGWANQIRVLTLRFQQLKATLGQGFINLFTPIIKMINSFIASIQNAANAFLRLTEIITGQESGSLGNMAADVSDISGAAGDASSNISGMGDSAASAAKKAQRALMGFDSINKISEADTSGGSSGGGTGVSSGGGVIANEFAKANTEASKLESTLTGMVEKVKKAWETGDFTEIGSIVADGIAKGLDSIKWDTIKQTAEKSGKSFATFLNGIFGNKDLFNESGEAVAEAFNTAVNLAFGFADNFNFKEAGSSVATAINKAFETFDAAKLASTGNKIVSGILNAAIGFLDTLETDEIGTKFGEFLKTLEWENILGDVGELIGKAVINGISFATASFKEAPLETFLITSFATLEFTGAGKILGGKIAESITKAAASSEIGTAATSIVNTIKTSLVTGVSTIWSTFTAAMTVDIATVFGAGTFAEIGTAIFGGIVGSIAAAIGGWKLGNWLYENNVFCIGDIADKIIQNSGVGELVTRIVDFFEFDLPDLTVELKGKIDEKAQEIKEWFANKKDDVKNLIANAKDNASGVIDKFKGKWNSITDKAPNLIATAKNNSEKVLNTLKGAWEKIVSNNPVLSASAKNNNSDVLKTLKSSWDAIKKRTATLTAKATNKDSKTLKSIKSAWNSIKSKTAQMTVKFQDSFTKPLKAAWNALAKKVQSAINTINKIPGVNITGKVPTFAKGGFPEEGPFYMNRGEIAGKFSNGKGVVANNAQITTGIANAVGPSVYQAVKSAMAISIPRIRTPQLAVASGTNEDKTLQRLLDVLTIVAAGGANADMIAMLKEILEFLKTMDRDVYMDGEKVTKIITDIINRTTDITGSCPVHT